MFNIMLNEDEAMIAASVREFLGAELPLERLRPNAAARNDEAVRKAMGDLGWFAVGLPEEAGGSGLGLVEEMLIVREFGRFVASPGLIAVMLAGHLHVLAGDPDQAAKTVDGTSSVGLALLGSDDGAGLPAMVFDWTEGDAIVGICAEGIGLFPAEAFSGAAPEECIDDSVSLHGGNLDRAAATVWLDAGETDLVERARVLLAAGLCGLAENACDLTVAYARIREQFGKPIGSFQAVKHRCADMGVRSRLAWYQTSVACLKQREGHADRHVQIDSALLLAAEAAHENARAGVQMHGGIGFQAECDIHWFAKRAHLYDQLGGGRAANARRISEYAPD